MKSTVFGELLKKLVGIDASGEIEICIADELSDLPVPIKGFSVLYGVHPMHRDIRGNWKQAFKTLKEAQAWTEKYPDNRLITIVRLDW